jgi:hypothetical protein
VELAAGGDAELGEDLAQVVLDGVGADEQPGADLGVGQALAGQLGNLGFLGGQLLAPRGRRGAPASGFPGGGGSHLIMISQPQAVTDVIVTAAKAVAS